MVISAAKATAVLVDDYPAIFGAIGEILQSVCRIVATVSDPQKAVVTIKACEPDIVVLDIGMSGMNGFEIARQLQSAGGRAKILFLTIVEDGDYLYAARKSGASYVIKRRMHLDLVTAVREMLEGRTFFSPLTAEKNDLS